MPSDSLRPRVCIEPLGPHHDRAAFACGNGHVDMLARQQLELQEAGLSRAYVAVRPGATAVLGLYATCSHTLQAFQVPEPWAALIVRYGLEGMPAAYISLFGVHSSLQGRGLGSLLFADALRRIKAAASDELLRPAIVFLDPIDERAERFYARFNFQRVPNAYGRRCFYPVAEIA